MKVSKLQHKDEALNLSELRIVNSPLRLGMLANDRTRPLKTSILPQSLPQEDSKNLLASENIKRPATEVNQAGGYSYTCQQEKMEVNRSCDASGLGYPSCSRGIRENSILKIICPFRGAR